MEGPVFEIVYIYASQFPEAVWTKLSLHVVHKETRDFNEPYLENLPVNRTPYTWPAGSDRETLPGEKGAGSARPPPRLYSLQSPWCHLSPSE